MHTFSMENAINNINTHQDYDDLNEEWYQKFLKDGFHSQPIK